MPKLLVDQDTGHIIWNLFLATVPVALAFLAAAGIRDDLKTQGQIRWAIWMPLLLVWLLFLPNTAYLVTEWRHYGHVLNRSRDALYDDPNSRPIIIHGHKVLYSDGNGEARKTLLATTLFYLAYTWYGLLAFFLAVWPLDRLTRGRIGKFEWLVRPGLFVLSALGVYLGLVNRFNSWQAVKPTHLIQIVASSVETFMHPYRLAVIIGFGLALWLLYIIFDIWMDGAAWRLRQRSGLPDGKPEAENVL